MASIDEFRLASARERVLSDEIEGRALISPARSARASMASTSVASSGQQQWAAPLNPQDTVRYDQRTRALIEGPIAATLLRLAAPNMLVMFAQASVGLVETYFVGKFGTDPLAGVALVFPVIMLMQMMAAGAMGGGISSAIARALGAGRRADAATRTNRFSTQCAGRFMQFDLLHLDGQVRRPVQGLVDSLMAQISRSSRNSTSRKWSRRSRRSAIRCFA
jgi:hypothetical protein